MNKQGWMDFDVWVHTKKSAPFFLVRLTIKSFKVNTYWLDNTDMLLFHITHQRTFPNSNGSTIAGFSSSSRCSLTPPTCCVFIVMYYLLSLFYVSLYVGEQRRMQKKFSHQPPFRDFQTPSHRETSVSEFYSCACGRNAPAYRQYHEYFK